MGELPAYFPPEDRITTRPAEERDIPWLLAELKEFSKFAETKHSLYPPYEEQAAEILRNLILDHYCEIAGKGEDRMGFLAGIVAPHVFNPSLLVCYEVFWWVPEKFRGTRAGLLLLNKFVEWSRKNVQIAYFSLRQNSPVSAKALFKRGFVEQERQFVLEV